MVDNQEQISSQSKVSLKLTKGMSPEEAKAFISSYQRAKKVLKRINEVAAKNVDQTSHMIDSPKGFETPNWQYLVAWQSGYRTAMRITQDLTRTK